jgi:hypothetical protein
MPCDRKASTERLSPIRYYHNPHPESAGLRPETFPFSLTRFLSSLKSYGIYRQPLPLVKLQA